MKYAKLAVLGLLAAVLLAVALAGCSDTPTVVLPEAAEHANRTEIGAAAVSVVMSNLESPRGLAFGPEGGALRRRKRQSFWR